MEWHDRSIALFAVTIAVLALSLIIVPLRCYVRISRRSFKIDDYLIVAAQVFHMGACAITMWGFVHGLGMTDAYLTEEEQMQGVQAFAMFKPVYTISTCLTKCSICFTMLRVASNAKIRRALYWIVIAVAGSSSIMAVGSFLYCVPYPAIWTHWHHPNTPGYCLPQEMVLTVAYAFAAVAIITDLCCTAIPGIMLWNSTMRTGPMVAAWMTLGCGVLAGLATACRLPYIMYWKYTHNQSYGLGRILLFELLESGLGIFASCAPALKPLASQGVTLCTSLLNRFSRWTTLGSQDHSHRSMEKAEEGLSRKPEDTPTPVPALDLIIPDIDDTVVDTVMDSQLESFDDSKPQIPVIVVHKIRANGGDYTQDWHVQQ